MNDRNLETVFTALTKDQEPQGAWEARVWARIANEPKERVRVRVLRLWQVTATLAGMVALALLVLFLSTRKELAERSDAERRVLHALIADQSREIERLTAERNRAQSELEGARDEPNRAAAVGRLQATERLLEAKRRKLEALRKRNSSKMKEDKRVIVDCSPTDPLCGL